MSRPSNSSAGSGSMPSTACVRAPLNSCGKISTMPPTHTATSVNAIRKVKLVSVRVPDAISSSGRYQRGRDDAVAARLGTRGSSPDVVSHDQHAAEKQCAAECAYVVAGVARFQRFDEGVGERSVGIRRAPHETLDEPV